MPVSPGTTVAPRTRIGITWSGCYGNGSSVPNVVGLTFAAAHQRTECRGPGVGLLLGRDGDDDDQHHGGVIDRFDQRWRGHDNDQTTADGAEPGPVTGCRAQGRRDGHHHHASLSPVSDRADAGDPTPTGALAEPARPLERPGTLGHRRHRPRLGHRLLDATVVGIALPSIGREFHGGVGTLQWVVTGYSLTLAALLLLGGSLGDRYGRKRIFTVGVVWFALASACCGLAPSAGLLIAARVRPGRRRRAAHPGQPRHPAGLVPPRRPRPGHRRLVGTERRGGGGRPAPRRLPHRRRLLALGLLHQPPAGRRGRSS